ncbi:MAG TPA: histidine phosphatase family protein [Bryobacteraceae bacterium]|jgi:phosphohistidine phosphatase|nr:histidine phosphatase family protein [Bryobacteraceae bacterium]
MELYLLRHGIAEDRAASGRDADRRLTDEGKKKLHKVLARAHKSGVAPTLILSSPLTRAMETAEIAADELAYNSEIVRTAALTPDSTPADVWAEIRAHRDEPSILLAGHEPLFSATVAGFVGSARAMVEFRKGALVRIDFSTIGAEPRGVLQWMLTAKVS